MPIIWYNLSELFEGCNQLQTINIAMRAAIDVQIIKHQLEKEPCQQLVILQTLSCMSILNLM